MDPDALASLDYTSDGLSLDQSAAGVTNGLPGYGYSQDTTVSTPLAVIDPSTVTSCFNLDPGATDGIDAYGNLLPSVDGTSELGLAAGTLAQQTAATLQKVAAQNGALGLTSGGFVSSSGDMTILLAVAAIAVFFMLKK